MRPTDSRSTTERRGRPTRPWDALWYRRRRGPRRAEERVRGYYADRYPRPAVITATVLVTLSAIDAAATLVLLRGDVTGELNPVMRAALGWGVGPFLAVKLGLTLACVGVFLVGQFHHLFFRWLRVGYLLAGFAVIYFAVNVYEAYLFLGA